MNSSPADHQIAMQAPKESKAYKNSINGMGKMVHRYSFTQVNPRKITMVVPLFLTLRSKTNLAWLKTVTYLLPYTYIVDLRGQFYEIFIPQFVLPLNKLIWVPDLSDFTCSFQTFIDIAFDFVSKENIALDKATFLKLFFCSSKAMFLCLVLFYNLIIFCNNFKSFQRSWQKKLL